MVQIPPPRSGEQHRQNPSKVPVLQGPICQGKENQKWWSASWPAAEVSDSAWETQRHTGDSDCRLSALLTSRFRIMTQFQEPTRPAEAQCHTLLFSLMVIFLSRQYPEERNEPEAPRGIKKAITEREILPSLCAKPKFQGLGWSRRLRGRSGNEAALNGKSDF